MNGSNLEFFAAPIPIDVRDSLPTWIQAISAAITAAGLIILGAWALFRFRRSRTYMPRCSITIVPSLHADQRDCSISAIVTVRNDGDSKLTLTSVDRARVEVSYVGGAAWTGASRPSRVEWPDAPWYMKDDLLKIGMKREGGGVDLEPQQEFHRGCLFRMPVEWSAARVSCVVTKEDDERVWRSSSVVLHPQNHHSIAEATRGSSWRRWRA
jgi:hypothetical protein